MKEKLIGILTLTVITATILVAFLTALSGEFFSATNVQLLIPMFTLATCLTGIYLMRSHAPGSKSTNRMAIGTFGIVLTLFATLVGFNIIPFLSTYNWLIIGGIIFILLVQLQLLNWGGAKKLLSRLAAVLMIAAALFLIIFFIAKWQYSGIITWINSAILVEILAFIIGLLTTTKFDKKSELS